MGTTGLSTSGSPGKGTTELPLEGVKTAAGTTASPAATASAATFAAVVTSFLDTPEYQGALSTVEERLKELRADSTLLLTKPGCLDDVGQVLAEINERCMSQLSCAPLSRGGHPDGGGRQAAGVARIEELKCQWYALDDERLQLELKRWLIGWGPVPTCSSLRCGPPCR